LLRVIAKCSNE
jgi:hypothetical protein